jgi:nitrite reductase/ring-hydroxylating ferredoxin subunit
MHRVCSLAELAAAGGRLAVVAGPRELLVLRDGADVRVVDLACPHEGFRLADGDFERGVLTCPAHGWRFDIATGACLTGEEDVRSYRVALAGEDVLVDDEVDATPRELELAVEGLLGALELGRPALAARRTARLLALGASPSELAALLARYGGSHAGAGLDPEVAVVADLEGVHDGDAWPMAAAGIAEQLARMPPRFGQEPATPFAWEELGVHGTLEALIAGEEPDAAEAAVAGMLAAGVAADDICAGLAAATAASFRGLWPLVVLERASRLAMLGPHVARAVLPPAAYGCAAGTGRPLPLVEPVGDAVGVCAVTLLAASEPPDCLLGCALALAHAGAAEWAVAVAGDGARPALAHAVGAARLFGPAGSAAVVDQPPGQLPPVRAETPRGFSICHAARHAAVASGHPVALAAVARLLAGSRRERFVSELLRDPLYELL